MTTGRPVLIAANSSDAADYIWRRQVPTDVIVVTPGNYEAALRGVRALGQTFTTEFGRLSNQYGQMIREIAGRSAQLGLRMAEPKHLRAL